MTWIAFITMACLLGMLIEIVRGGVKIEREDI